MNRPPFDQRYGNRCRSPVFLPSSEELIFHFDYMMDYRVTVLQLERKTDAINAPGQLTVIVVVFQRTDATRRPLLGTFLPGGKPTPRAFGASVHRFGPVYFRCIALRWVAGFPSRLGSKWLNLTCFYRSVVVDGGGGGQRWRCVLTPWCRHYTTVPHGQGSLIFRWVWRNNFITVDWIGWRGQSGCQGVFSTGIFVHNYVINGDIIAQYVFSLCFNLVNSNKIFAFKFTEQENLSITTLLK